MATPEVLEKLTKIQEDIDTIRTELTELDRRLGSVEDAISALILPRPPLYYSSPQKKVTCKTCRYEYTPPPNFCPKCLTPTPTEELSVRSSSPQLLVPTIMSKTATYMREKYRRVPEAVHVHDLTRCSLKREMEERYPELAEKTLYEPPVQIGEMLHTFVEALPTIDRAQEVFERTVNRYLVVGKPDVTTEDAVYDLKYRERLYARPLAHDVLRTSIYAWLAGKPYGHVVYLNPREFREWVVSPVTTETVLWLIEHPISPRWRWECRLCPFKGVCPLIVRPLRGSRSGEEIEYEWH